MASEDSFSQKDFLERLDTLQKRVLSEENSLQNFRDSLGSLPDLDFDDDEAKRDSIMEISMTFRKRDELLLNIMSNYRRMYDQTLLDRKSTK